MMVSANIILIIIFMITTSTIKYFLETSFINAAKIENRQMLESIMESYEYYDSL